MKYIRKWASSCPLFWVSYLGKPTRVRWPARPKSWACLWPLHWHVWWIIMWHHEMAMGMTPEFHGNIVGTWQECHGSIMTMMLEHGNIMYPSERQWSVSVWFPGGWWSCSFWWVNDQPSNAMPLAETLHKSLEIHPDYMKAAQYLPCTAACHYT